MDDAAPLKQRVRALCTTMTVWVRLSAGEGALVRAMAKHNNTSVDEQVRGMVLAGIDNDMPAIG